MQKALTKVTRPLQLKDLFYANVTVEEVKKAEEDLKARKEEQK